MTRTEAYDTMRELLNGLGARGVLATAAEVLEDRANGHRRAAGDTADPARRARQVVLCGATSRDASTLRELAGGTALSDGGIPDTLPAYLPDAFDSWNSNELYIRPGGTLGSKSTKRLEPSATAALRKVYGSDAAAFHDDATRWLAINTGK